MLSVIITPPTQLVVPVDELKAQLRIDIDAEDALLEAEAVAHSLGDQITLARSLSGLGYVAFRRSELDVAEARWREALAKKLPAEVLDELGRVIEDLQYLRHAPQLSATGSLRAEVLARSRRLLRRMS